jgi:hypothetical protein
MEPRVVRRAFSSVLALGVLSLLVVAAQPAAAQATVIVRPGESIQHAVDAAGPGTTIVVRPGTYAEHVAITSDGIKLVGFGATLVPPAGEQPANACSFGPVATDGVCVAGDFEFDADGNVVINDPVSDVTVSGFTVRGFPGTGVIFLGAENPNVSAIRAEDDAAYGIARFFSTGGSIIGNRASGAEVSGIYVGDSPDADVLISANETFDNDLFGFFLRDAANGRLVANHAHDNCVGAIVLNDGANVAGNWSFTANAMANNTRFCPGDGEDPAISGIGVALVNASDNTIRANVFSGNVPGGPVDFSGGVVVLDAQTPGADPPSDNTVRFNLFRGNQPDIFWDGSGAGNAFRNNSCSTSVPAGLC